MWNGFWVTLKIGITTTTVWINKSKIKKKKKENKFKQGHFSVLAKCVRHLKIYVQLLKWLNVVGNEQFLNVECWVIATERMWWK